MDAIKCECGNIMGIPSLVQEVSERFLWCPRCGRVADRDNLVGIGGLRNSWTPTFALKFPRLVKWLGECPEIEGLQRSEDDD